MSQEFGLSQTAAEEKLKESGYNEILAEAKPSALRLFILQFKSPLVLVLIFACVISFAMGEKLDAIAIFTILVLNAGIGFFLEQKAEASISALQNLTAPRALVVRDGMQKNILAREVVEGDILVLEPGDVIAADSIVIQASRVLVNEAILTGESVPVEKKISEVLYMGTVLVAGTATARVSGTGMKTELGKIAHLLKAADSGPTPLQVQLKKVGDTLLLLCLAVVGVVLIAGLLKGISWMEISFFAMSLAVAAVPEGMPAIVTIALALGVQRMTARKALIRSLPSLETLGCVSVICTDKTGTLTTGLMRVREIWGADPGLIINAAVSCVEAELDSDNLGTGDPTEVAILLAGRERNIEKKQIETNNPRISAEPFDSERRRMSIFRKDGKNYVKGAVENILPLCVAGCDTTAVLKATDDMTSRGLRVLAVGVGSSSAEEELQFLGLLGIADPPRTEVIEAIQVSRDAGILTVMITGDHAKTAQAIAREIGLLRDGEALETRVHARATPEEKLKLVRHWKERGEVVAMTGDGVNDAPALREAHVGIAMGRGGSEVTRQAADLVLADDNYATIISAVREGRHIFNNIRRALVYLLTGNIAEVILVLAAMILGLPIPLLAAHLLWINLVTDSLPALTLMAEPLAPDTMKNPPRKISEKLLGRPEWLQVVGVGLLESVVILLLYVFLLSTDSASHAQGLVFTALVFSQLFRAFSARSKNRVFWEVGLFSNLWLLGVVVMTGMLQISLHFMPLTQKIFNLNALTTKDLILAGGISLIPVTVVELRKWIARHLKSS